MRVKLDNKIEIDAYWLHGTYNSTLWLAKDEDGMDTYDLYYGKDREELGLETSPYKVQVNEPVVIHFYHGRENKDQQMDDWGTDGPSILATEVVLNREGLSYKEVGSGFTTHLLYDEDLLLVNGIYYGDVEVTGHIAE